MSYPYYTRDVTDLDPDRQAPQRRWDDPAGYLPDAGLVNAVNVALMLGRPLLVTGHPGTGKTQLAYSIAWQLWRRRLLNIASGGVEKFETKSTSLARDLFYSFDTLRRFHAAHIHGSDNNLEYITYNALGAAILNAFDKDKVGSLFPAGFAHAGPTRSVVLIDEVDKAPRDFPNDLLNEIEQMYFKVPELGNIEIGGHSLSDEFKPIVVITSNSERNLPDPFLRRCIYYDIPFPDESQLKEILVSRLPLLSRDSSGLLTTGADFFFKLRRENVTRRPVSPAELIQWLAFMLARGARAEQPLSEVAPVALEGLSALTKDPSDQPKVESELRRFVETR